MAKAKKRRSHLEPLVLASRACRTALSARLAAQGLHPGQDALLLALGAEDGLSLRDLAVRLAVRPPTVTKSLSRLSAHGMVEKRASPNDARQSHAFLTKRGRAAVKDVKAAQDAIEATAFAGFSPRERRKLRKLLARIERNLGDAADPAETEPDP